MRKGLRDAVIKIERLHAVPLASSGRMRTTVDAVFTVAVGAVCACALTLGPVPVNTVAATGAALSASSSSSAHDEAETSTLDAAEAPPADPSASAAAGDAESDDEADATAPRSEKAPAPSRSPARSAPLVPPPTSAGTAQDEKAVTPSEQPQGRMDTNAYNPTAAKFAADPIAATIDTLNAVRLASGLSPLVDAASCPDSSPYAQVRLTPGGTLPVSRARAALAPDPANATVSVAADGGVSVSVVTCG